MSKSLLIFIEASSAPAVFLLFHNSAFCFFPLLLIFSPHHNLIVFSSVRTASPSLSVIHFVPAFFCLHLLPSSFFTLSHPFTLVFSLTLSSSPPPYWLKILWHRCLLSQPRRGVSSSPLSSVQIRRPTVSSALIGQLAEENIHKIVMWQSEIPDLMTALTE